MSRAKHLFGRFGTLHEQLNNKPTRAIERVNRAAQAITEEEENPLGILERVKGMGRSEVNEDAPTYAEHGPDYVRFAGMTTNSLPFIATAPRLSTDEGIAWINSRISGFSRNPKSRESVEEAIRRKCLAAHGEDFVNACRAKGGKMVEAEIKTMFSPESHSGIGDLDLYEKRSDKVNITIDRDGTVHGISTGILKGNDGQIYATPDMLNNTIAGGRDVQ